MFSGVRNPDLACFFGVNVFAENGAGVNKLQISRLIRKGVPGSGSFGKSDLQQTNIF